MNLERVVGSVATDQGPKPFVLYVQTGRFELGTYVYLDDAQQRLSVTQLQRFAQLVGEHANVSFAQVRVGEYACPACRRWVRATPDQWSGSVCTSCSLDRTAKQAAGYAMPGSAPSADWPEEAGVIEAVLGLDEDDLLERALLLAVEAHRGQRDKAGRPYVLHPLRLMLRMETPEQQMVALLHDVVEDTGWTLEGLRREGFPEAVVEAVEGLTRREGESYEAFVERAAKHPLARRVKLADLEDNMDLRRLGPLSTKDTARLEKYQQAWRRLKELGRGD